MKLSSDQVKAGLMLAAAAGVAYVVYRGAKSVSGVAGSVAEKGAAVVHELGNAWDSFNAPPTPGPDGNWLGMPEPEAVTSEPELARWIIDNIGSFEASKWVTMGALIKAWTMPAGSGRPPAPSSEAGRYLLPKVAPQASYDETDRLSKRYPAPSTSYYETAGRYAGSGSGSADERSFEDLSKPGGIWGY